MCPVSLPGRSGSYSHLLVCLFGLVGLLGCSGGGGASSSEPVVSFESEVSALFGEAVGDLSVPLRLSSPVSFPVEIEFRAVGGSASDGADFILGPSPLIIPPGATEGLLPLTVIADDLFERSEQIRIRVSSRSSVRLAANQIVREIVDDDPAPEMLIAFSGGDFPEDAGSLDIELMLSRPSGLFSGAEIRTGGDAVAGQDFVFEVGPQVAIPAGESSFSARIRLLNDTLVQGARSLTLQLAGGENAILSDAIVDLRILDDEEPLVVGFRSEQATAVEGAAIQVELALASAFSAPVEIPVVVSGTAGEADRVIPAGNILFPAGAQAAMFTLQTLQDASDEFDETVVVTLGTPIGGAIVGPDGVFTLTILDDDEPPVVSILSSGGADVVEDGLAHDFLVSVDVASGKQIVVDFALTGEASSPGDYSTPFDDASVLTIEPGVSLFEVEVTLVDDFEPESDETLVLELRPEPINATLGAVTFDTLRIVDNDVDPDVIFVAELAESSNRGLFASDHEGTRTIRLAGDAVDVANALLSPDGGTIGFLDDVASDSLGRLYVLDARGGEPVFVADSVSAYRWSVDGDRLAFLQHRGAPVTSGGTGASLSVVNASGLFATSVFDEGVDAFEWEPGGSSAGRLAFTAAANGTPGTDGLRLYVADPSSSVRLELTGPSQGIDGEPGRGPAFRWAPDGSAVAYRATVGGLTRAELFVAKADGSERRRVSGGFFHAGGDVRTFEWAPGSAVLAFVADRAAPERFELFVTDAAQEDAVTGISRETEGQSLKSFTWQPPESGSDDPALLAYVSDRSAPEGVSGLDELWVVEQDGRNEINLSDTISSGDTVEPDFAWSADGSRLAFRAGAGSGESRELRAIRSDGSQLRRVSQTAAQGRFVSSFAWAPEGLRIAYLVDLDAQGTTQELFSTPANQEGSFLRLSGSLAAGGSVEDFLWRGDASGLVFRADAIRDGFFQLFATAAEQPITVALPADQTGGTGVSPVFITE